MHEKNQLIKDCIDLRACSYSSWYNDFQKITIKSHCEPIPQALVDYFLDEIIILPKECYATETDLPEDDDEDGALEMEPQPEFPEFSRMIADKISDLGGAAYIKTNWHSPKDAFWITAGQTMCCKDITDVYQLLKASSICKQDLSCHSLSVFDVAPNDIATSEADRAVNISTNQYLIFKKWHDIHPGTEFRCFVRNKCIVGISPRDWPQYHEHICSQKLDIANDIVTMFKEQIKHKFPLFDYVFDVVRDAKDRVYLVDFAPFGEKWSESLAFEWTDLESDNFIPSGDDEEDPEFRYLSSDCGIQPSKRNNYGIPKDVIDMFRASSSSSSNANGASDDSESEDSRSPERQTLDDVINNRLENIFRNEANLSDNDDRDDV